MKAFYILVFTAIVTVTGWAQHPVLGVIIDSETRLPVSQVNVIIEGSQKGMSTNADGRFELNTVHFPLKLKISHVAYADTVIVLRELPEKPLLIFLRFSAKSLPVFSVSGNKVQSVTRDYPFYVSDYLFHQDGIILMVFYEKRLFDPRLVFLDKYGKIKWMHKLDRYGSLYKDCIDNIYLVGKDSVSEMDFSDSLQIIYPKSWSLDYFKSNLKIFDAEINRKFFFKFTSFHNLKHHFAKIDLDGNQKVETFRLISDSLKIERLKSQYNVFFFAKHANKMQMSVTSVVRYLEFLQEGIPLSWEEENIYYKPAYCPMMKYGDSLLIFNQIDGRVEAYNEQGEYLFSDTCRLLNDEKWKGEVLADNLRKEVWFLMIKSGKSILKKWENGKYSSSYEVLIPEFAFVEKIQILDGIVYFLYKRNVNQEYKELYKMRIDG